ncbi:MAG: hypothetical protein QM733_05240 [Ilumatobacteraceae bacterium]
MDPAPWNPWRALRDRPEIELRFADLGTLRGLWQRDHLGELIVLDAGLDRRARRCVLAHELIHAERGIGHGAASPASMEHEEEAVRRETARRLVPTEPLTAFVDARIALDEPVLVEDVADEFDVEHDVAAKALDLLRLAQRRCGGRRC